jgi:hypothetical protein
MPRTANAAGASDYGLPNASPGSVHPTPENSRIIAEILATRSPTRPCARMYSIHFPRAIMHQHSPAQPARGAAKKFPAAAKKSPEFSKSARLPVVTHQPDARAMESVFRPTPSSPIDKRPPSSRRYRSEGSFRGAVGRGAEPTPADDGNETIAAHPGSGVHPPIRDPALERAHNRRVARPSRKGGRVALATRGCAMRERPGTRCSTARRLGQLNHLTSGTRMARPLVPAAPGRTTAHRGGALLHSAGPPRVGRGHPG